MGLYKGLLRAQRKNRQTSPEEAYFRERLLRLSSIEYYRHLAKANSPFEILRANIVLRALENKERIEKAYLSYPRFEGGLSLSDYMAEALSELPYLSLPEGRNYVPILPRSLLTLYSVDFEKLGVEPYSRMLRDYEGLLLDPFDLYGPLLFNSGFSPLLPIYTRKNALCAYDLDAERLYFIDGDGRLESEVALFDKGLPRPDKSHLLERLLRVAKAYYANDEEAFLRALIEGNLVSSSLLRKLVVPRKGKHEEGLRP